MGLNWGLEQVDSVSRTATPSRLTPSQPPPQEAWLSGRDNPPKGRCRFVLSPPRHFLYPALLLLLTEEPRHGYLLSEVLTSLGLGRMDRPSVYRALAELERDGLVRTWDAEPTAGSTRHVHAVTPEGQQALDAWMSIVAQERNSLDLVLERYWYCNTRQPGALGTDDEGARTPASAAVGRPPQEAEAPTSDQPTRFEIRADRSSLIVEARSSVGPIAFSATNLAGWIKVELHDGLVSLHNPPSAHLEARVADLTSGNTIYDRELLRRADVRRYPVVSVELTTLHRLGEGNCYRVDGDLTLNGVTRRVDGVVTATVHERLHRSLSGSQGVDRSLIVAGEQVLSIRHFDLGSPGLPLFKFYPEVRLRLHLEADQT